MQGYFMFFMHIDGTHGIVFPFNYLIPICGLGCNFQSSRSSFLNLLNLQNFFLGGEQGSRERGKKKREGKKSFVSDRDLQMYLCPTTYFIIENV